MQGLIVLMKMVAVVLAGIAVGNWFLTKVKEGRARSDPWYKAYLTVPGLIILVAVLGLPVAWWLLNAS